jgi:hypothetical protein
MVQTMKRWARWADIKTDVPWVSAAGSVLLLALLGWVAALALDRDPPTTFIRVEPAAARAGDWVTIVAHVDRDDRPCAMRSVRNFTDSQGLTVGLPGRELSAREREDISVKTPGISRIAIQIPPVVAPGPGAMTSTMRFSCNVTQEVAPIIIQHVFPVEVLP